MLKVPLTDQQFFGLFRTYNEAVWPIQWALLGSAVLLVLFVMRRGALPRAVTLGFLAVLWAWTGAVYHLFFFTRINPAAYLFGTLFLLQALLIGVASFRARGLEFGVRRDLSGLLGGGLIVYALLLYPLLGRLAGHSYPAAPTFGAPCPTTIFTFGLLLWSRGRFPLSLLVVPFLWSLLGSTAALNWGVYEDLMMPVSAVLTVAVLVARNRRLAQLEHREAAELVGV